jgi:hypothetical protein
MLQPLSFIRIFSPVLGILCAVSLPVLADAGEAGEGLRILPSHVQLGSPEASEQVLVFARDEVDVTRDVTYTVVDPSVAVVTTSGRVQGLQDGQTEIEVQLGTVQARLTVQVSGISQPPAVSFRHDIIPILSKATCNSGGCHGKAEGQNGFKLSVFGYDAAADHNAIVHDARGRRIFPASPGRSLLLVKGTAELPHGGGLKIESGSRWYKLIERWITEGAELDEDTGERTVAIRVEPSEVTLAARGQQQLRVVARDAGGVERCVTVEADYQSNNEVIAGVEPSGLVAATEVPGEAAILVRYMGHVAVCRVTRPRAAESFARLPERNFVDRLVWDKLERLHVPPSPLAGDAELLRRTYLDVLGTLPTAEEARRYLNDTHPEKHRELVLTLLQREEYADYWTQLWSDLLQIDKDIVEPAGAVAMTRWVHQQFKRNRPFDQFAAEVLTAQGASYSESPAAFYHVHGDAEKSARAISQLFLGVRIDCAQCHHHPFERWDQQDYYGLASFFTGVQRKPLTGGAVKIVGGTAQALKHPRTAEAILPTALGEPPQEIEPGVDQRRRFAEWATSPRNPFFTRTIVNRLVAHYFGRGLVEPIDDLRDTNPASNEPLMRALVEHMIEVDYDLKAFTATLLDSNVYRLSSQATEANQLDEQNYSRAAWKPIPAEVLLDAVAQVTGVPEQFNGWPEGYRAVQVWDNKLPSDFLEVFGRPPRQTVCACERGSEASIAQALHLMNSTTISEKLQARTGHCARLAESTLSDAEIVDELYLMSLSRLPTTDERALMLQAFPVAQGDTLEVARGPQNPRRQAVEDVLWTLLNSREFVFNH